MQSAKYSLTMAALFFSFLNRNFFSFFCKSSSTAHTLRLVACTVWWERGRRERERERERERVTILSRHTNDSI